ncbi:MAG: HAMP domain-containing histidine kinase [Nitrosomonadales bacterium]|nr:HAMP domain-containing histidine kinase [Nitrosomonadales bacterium]
MTLRNSLQLRIAFSIALLAIVIVSAHSIALYSITDEQEEELIDQVVTEELYHFIIQYREDPNSPPPALEALTGYVVRNDAEHAQLPEELRDLPTGLHEVEFEDGERHIGVRAEPEGRFYMVYNVVHHEERMHDFRTVLVLGVVATALLAAALGYWLAGLLVQPMNDLASRVERLGAGRPQAPLAADYADQEVKRLAHAFDGYLHKVADLIQREQEFTANVSHELRTPLTAIRTSCELLLQEPALAETKRRRVEAIDRAAQRLADSARSLLFLARSNNVPEPEEVSVRECVNDAAETLTSTAREKGINLEVAVAASAVVRADRHALFLVASNLLRNAVAYTERGYVRATYNDGCLTIEDSGRGIDAVELPHIFERYYRGTHPTTADGAGLGLAIVKRICERFGWPLEIDSSVKAGTRASVYLASAVASQEVHTQRTKT